MQTELSMMGVVGAGLPPLTEPGMHYARWKEPDLEAGDCVILFT